MMKMFGKWALLIIAILSVFLGTSLSTAQAKSKIVVGQPAPEAIIELVSGERINLSQLRGQVVVINFWATWCVPCRRELPTLDAYYKMQKAHGLRVFAATTEDSVPQSLLKQLFSHMNIDPVRRLRGPYAPLTGVPTNFVIDRAGIVRYADAGAFDLDALNQILVPLLREPAPPVVEPNAKVH